MTMGDENSTSRKASSLAGQETVVPLIKSMSLKFRNSSRLVASTMTRGDATAMINFEGLRFTLILTTRSRTAAAITR